MHFYLGGDFIKQTAVPVGKQGIAKIERFEVDKHGSMISALRHEYVPEGEYTRLYVGRTLMMSNTPMEIRSNAHIINCAHGRVLIAGSGIGLILTEILSKPEVESVTVIEKYQDVIDLVAPHFKSNKLRIVCADIFGWKPDKGETYDTIYFDIWPDINTENLEDVRKLHRRARYWKNRENPGAFVDSWMHDELKRMLRQESRRGIYA